MLSTFAYNIVEGNAHAFGYRLLYLLERSTSKEFHRNNSPDGKTPRSSPNINYELCIAITSAAINNLYRQIDAAVNLHNMNILLGFYDDIQNDRITPHLTGWGGSPAGEPETR